MHKLGEDGQKVESPVVRQMCSGNIMYSMVTIGNKIIVYT